MAAGSSNSAAGVLTQLSEASNSSSDKQDNKVDDSISIFHLPQGQVLPRPARRQSQQVKHGIEIAAVPQL